MSLPSLIAFGRYRLLMIICRAGGAVTAMGVTADLIKVIQRLS